MPITEFGFIQRYGNYSKNYKYVNELGKNNQILLFAIPFFSLIGSGILFSKSTQKYDSNGNPIEKTSTEKIFRYLAWFLLLIAILFGTYLGYVHFALYLPEYKDWYNKLPIDAKNDLNIMKNMRQMNTTLFNLSNKS